ncbi:MULTISPECIES: phosphoserine phosphatase SerB [unclassified Sphingomonas]|jgi:phosphoserine phosphatase|uniref:phosphoserine phosphatase SerB n=1 Tax=unclassified Sphingomonas TaxID=196159 RepID=UPI000834C688|nr:MULTISPECIES: phosphoserine phosphatase SerB [unclassified Sphingomonas]MCH4892233.1 phosphoserine phosphatase SerB [Sphingomonas sp. SFZ2018-12]
MFIATVIAAAGVHAGDISELRDRLHDAGCGPVDWGWIDDGIAADIAFGLAPDAARVALEGAIARSDIVVQPAHGRRKHLLVADMDSTMITVECIDELADYAGLKAEISAVTERAMRGELDFEAALDSRVALLAGLEEGTIDECLADRVEVMPGAVELVRTMRGWGAVTVLVSGGFTRFAEPVGATIGFDRVIANRLEIADAKLTGRVLRPIVDARVKEQVLLDTAAAERLDRPATLAVGDGANDLPMLRAAGLGIAYHAKPVVAAEADARIGHHDLTALLYAQGVPRAQWVE